MPNIIIGKFKEVDPETELFLGHQFDRNGERAIEKKCDYCGKYFTFDVKDVESWDDNVKMGFNGYPEKVHCGSSHCEYYHYRVLAHQQRENKKWAERGKKLFFLLQKAGIVK